MDLQYVLRLPEPDFAKATQLIENEIRKSALPKDYYLHELSNEELYDMVKNVEEWSRQDVIAAKIILEERKYHIDVNQLQEEKKQLKQAKKQKQKISLPVLLLFYVLAPLGAFLPVFVGLMIYNIKDTDQDGNRDYVFSDRYRKHGIILSVIGIFSMIAWMMFLRFSYSR